LLTVTSLMSESQVFPVQSTVQLTPPYSLYLSDYAAPGFERLRLTAFLTDATRPELNVRFRLRIEGNGIKIETKSEFLPPPVTLLGGVPLQLISSDLAAYFDPRNLNFTGITQRELEQRGALPEGLYQFCFEVIEYNRGVKISNTGCAVAWLILNDPPIVNLPRDNEKIRIQDPQQVVFQWTPRHRGSPNSAFNAEYDFKMVEVWPSTRNPNDAILTSPVIFQTTTSETTLIYGPAETPLEPGRRYAFQLRARAYAGADEVSLFKNNGFSQVYTFVYGDACLAPQNIIASDIGTTRFSVNFDGTPNQTGYSLRYRPAKAGTPSLEPVPPYAGERGTGGEVWYTTTSLTPNLTINSLQPNTRYEYQLSSSCGTFTSDYSPLTNIATKDNPGIQYSCGVPLTPFNLDPSQLIDVLKVGDIIKAGDFDVVLSKVTGSNGVFSGEGVIEVSYFNRAKVKAEFTNINISKELRMVNGYMNVTGAGVEIIPANLLNLMDDLDEVLAKADKFLDEYEANLPEQFDENAAVTSTLITVPSTATISQGSNGSVVIVDGSGKRTELPAGTTASVVDGTGKGYIIDSKGKVHTTTAAIATQAANREYNLKLKFAASAEQKFGFDEKKYDPIASTYTKVENQYLSWKSVATGQTDKVIATLEGTGIDKTKIRYELGGLELRPQELGPNAQSPSPNPQVLEFRGTADGLEEELIALYNPNPQSPSPNTQSPTPKTQVLGKLSVVTYDELVKDLVIVPLNGNKYPYGEDALRTQLNKIYGQAVVKWNITFAQNFDVPGIDPFDDGGSGLLSNYSPDMRKVVSAYKANLQPHTYYLFLVKNPKAGTLAGYMPRSKECGFIFVDKNGSEETIIHTMAHELGHGAFTLQHPFADEKYTMKPQGSTNNLMDYTVSGTALYKYQWDRMRYPEIVMGLFEEDEEGAMIASLKTSLENFEEDNPFGWLSGRNRNKFGFPEETSTLIWNFFVNRGSIEEEVRIELAWRLHQVAGAIWENGGLANVLNKIEKGEVPTWKIGAKALDEITPAQRASIKASDANKMSAILLEEFAYGKGPKQTDFTQTDAFTRELNKDDVLLKEAIGKFYREILDKKFTDEVQLLNVSPYNGTFLTNYTFSPGHTGSILESWQKHLNAWNDNPIAFVIGGMRVEIKRQTDKFIVKFINPMGLYSLGLHLLTDYNPSYRSPLATIDQTFTFELTTNEFRAFK
jgi:hypothetical protein